MNKKWIRGLILVLFSLAFSAFFYFDLNQIITLNSIQKNHANLMTYYQHHMTLVTVVFTCVYIIITALSLPAAGLLTILGGAIFGFTKGLIIISFSSTIGATAAFLMARFLLKDWVQKTYGNSLSKINDGFKHEGAFYLFALRLVPIFPFFLVNLVTALVPIKTWTFYWVSQLGMLAGTSVYVFTGTQLGQISTLSGILSPKLLIAFTLLGVFPILSKKLINIFRKGRDYR